MLVSFTELAIGLTISAVVGRGGRNLIAVSNAVGEHLIRYQRLYATPLVASPIFLIPGL